jgi:hypothetical protein
MSMFCISFSGIASAAAYQLGIFDRPKFEKVESIVKSGTLELYCIVGTTREKTLARILGVSWMGA